MGSVKTGVILKDVSLEVHGGEVLAILGSKGERHNSAHCVLHLKLFLINEF
jgi:ABC-type transporter Mla maintaining outer membrane lipid asymmetry ATPase subunit MlaF